VAFSVIIPTHDHADTLWFSVESVLQQTRQDFEIFIIGDGAPPRTQEIADALHARDSRIHYFPFEKGARHGESHRDTVIAQTSAEFVCYLADDDLWFPDHLETMDGLLRDADLAHTMQIEVFPDGTPRTWIFDADRDPLARESMGRSGPAFGLACGGHTLTAYRRLPRGWQPAPTQIPSGYFFWLLFLNQPWCRYTSFKWPTVLHLSSVTRRGWSLASRVAELSAVARMVQNPASRARMVRDSFLPVVNAMVANEFRADQALVRARIAELAGHELRPTLPSYALGTELKFGAGAQTSRIRSHGFHAPENWGCWTASERAGITIPIPEGTAGDLLLAITARYLLAAPKHQSARLAIEANAVVVFETTENMIGPVTYQISVLESVYRSAGCIVLEFVSELHSPLELGINQDDRRLGVGLISVRVDRAPGN
jgi:hypothetical protein